MDSEPEGADLDDIRLALQGLEIASSHQAFRLSRLEQLVLENPDSHAPLPHIRFRLEQIGLILADIYRRLTSLQAQLVSLQGQAESTDPLEPVAATNLDSLD